MAGAHAAACARDAHEAQSARRRTCYRHLAARLGVAWLGALERERIVVLAAEGVVVPASGEPRLHALGSADTA